MPLDINHDERQSGQSSVPSSRQYDLPLVYRILVRAYLRDQETNNRSHRVDDKREKKDVL